MSTNTIRADQAFKKVSIILTPEQVEILSPFFREVDEAYERDKAPDGEERAAILGQVFAADRGVNAHIDCYLLNTEQGTIVAKAIRRAMKVKNKE